MKTIKVTHEQLIKLGACEDYLYWFKQSTKDNSAELHDVIKLLSNQDKTWWMHWLLTVLMGNKQRIKYAIYAAEAALPIFEAKYNHDKRPRDAIDAAKSYLENGSITPSAEADAAYDAADTDYDDFEANAAYAAAHAAYTADTPYAENAADAALRADAVCTATSKEKIVNYGFELLYNQKDS